MRRSQPTNEDFDIWHRGQWTRLDWDERYSFVANMCHCDLADGYLMDNLTNLAGIPPAVQLTLAGLATIEGKP